MRRLNRDYEEAIAEAVVEALAEEALDPDCVIPGLILAIKEIAAQENETAELIEQAAELLVV